MFLFIHSNSVVRTAEAVGWPKSRVSLSLTWKPFTLNSRDSYTQDIIHKEVMQQVFHRAVLNIVGGQGSELVFKNYYCRFSLGLCSGFPRVLGSGDPCALASPSSMELRACKQILEQLRVPSSLP